MQISNNATTRTHTLIPGLDLVVHNDDHADVVTLIKELFDRKSHLESIECAVKAILEIDDENYRYNALVEILEAAGYATVMAHATGAEFAAMIPAVAPVLSLCRLARTAQESDRQVAKIHGIESTLEDDESDVEAQPS